MSGVNYRGRARLRDQQATERLSALLNGVTQRTEQPGTHDQEKPAPAGQEHPARQDEPERGAEQEPPTESAGPQHREPVAVRTFFARPAAVVLVAVLLLVCGVSALSLTPLGSDADSSEVVTADTPEAGRDRGEAGTEAGSAGPARDPAPVAVASASNGAPAEGPGSLAVHVVGEVRKPAVVQLSPGARVIDAVEAAGGLTNAAVTERVNLAQPVTDGQQVMIPNERTQEELDTAAVAGAAGGGTEGANPGADAAGGTSEGNASAPGGAIDLNSATAAELEQLPRVGPVLAQRIVEFRTQHGPFTAVEQLDDVSGIGPAMLEALTPLVTV